MCIHQSAWFTLQTLGLLIFMVHLEEMFLFVIAVHFFVLNFLIFLVHLADTEFLFHVDSLLYDGFFCLLVHLRVRINLPRQFILFIWITFADDPFVISIFIILYDSLIN